MTSRARSTTWAVAAIVVLILTAMAVSARSEIKMETSRGGMTMDDAVNAAQGK